MRERREREGGRESTELKHVTALTKAITELKHVFKAITELKHVTALTKAMCEREARCERAHVNYQAQALN